jgi:glycosyltransferase involved in cell wall biosynthesis
MARIAVYAPLKPPDHPTPSGDREIARLFMEALRRAGHAPFVASRLRLREPAGDVAAQGWLCEEASVAAERLSGALAADPPALWFTYHSYWKAPDLLGPLVAGRLGIPYVVAEPIHAPARLSGPWAGFAEAALAGFRRADRLVWTKPRDLPALRAIARPGQLAHLPPFLDPGPAPGAPPPHDGLRLLAVAMMRPGDKLASFAALAAALRLLPGAWSLTVAGDGPARPQVEALFAGLPVDFAGLVEDRAALRALYEAHDLMVWPGVGEGIGMVYLEAQAAGCPALAEDHPGPAAVLPGPLPPPGDPATFAAVIRRLAGDPGARAAARALVLDRHGIDAAAARLGEILAPLVGGQA